MPAEAARAELIGLLGAYLGEPEGVVRQGTASDVLDTVSLLSEADPAEDVVAALLAHALRNK